MASGSRTTATTPGLVAGTWTIDPVHSEVGFSVRHMMVSKVRGRFAAFGGQIVIAEDPADSRVTVSINLDSIETGNAQRDAHLRSADFFEVETYPTMTYRSTGLRPAGNDDYLLDGELTLKGVTRSVPLRVSLVGAGPDAYGGTRAGFSATTEINRHDFDVSFSAVLETGGVVVGDRVSVELEIEAILDA